MYEWHKIHLYPQITEKQLSQMVITRADVGVLTVTHMTAANVWDSSEASHIHNHDPSGMHYLFTFFSTIAETQAIDSSRET